MTPYTSAMSLLFPPRGRTHFKVSFHHFLSPTAASTALVVVPVAARTALVVVPVAAKTCLVLAVVLPRAARSAV